MHILVSGDAFFLNRYSALIDWLGQDDATVTMLASGNLASWMPQRLYNRVTRGTRWHDRLLAPDPNPTAFKVRSKQTARRIAALHRAPDVILHVFGSFAPAWREPRVPYTMYLDFTMAQAIRHWPPWADFSSERAKQRWLRFERTTYARAEHLFVMSDAVRDAVVGDYGVAAARVSVVDHAGTFDQPYEGEKPGGRLRLVFDGSDMPRKGGDIVLEALAIVRRALPDATLTLVGRRLDRVPEGVSNPGVVTPSVMRQLFLESDLVVAPARCDPFPCFVIEGLSYGVPCVVSAANGVAGVIRASGAGLVVDGFDPDAYARAIASLLVDPQRRGAMAVAGRGLVRDRLNFRRIAERMGPVLRAVAGRAGIRPFPGDRRSHQREAPRY